MPKSVFVIIRSQSSLHQAQQLAQSWDWAKVDAYPDYLRITEPDGATCLLEPTDVDWEWRPVIEAGLGDSTGMWALLATCRSEQLLAKVVQTLAPAFDGDVWIVDDGESPTRASAVDPRTLRL